MLDKLAREGLAAPLDELNLLELDQEIADCHLRPELGKTWVETKHELNALRKRQ